jgi:hypothetical protein
MSRSSQSFRCDARRRESLAWFRKLHNCTHTQVEGGWFALRFQRLHACTGEPGIQWTCSGLMAMVFSQSLQENCGICTWKRCLSPRNSTLSVPAASKFSLLWQPGHLRQADSSDTCARHLPQFGGNLHVPPTYSLTHSLTAQRTLSSRDCFAAANSLARMSCSSGSEATYCATSS